MSYYLITGYLRDSNGGPFPNVYVRTVIQGEPAETYSLNNGQFTIPAMESPSGETLSFQFFIDGKAAQPMKDSSYRDSEMTNPASAPYFDFDQVYKGGDGSSGADGQDGQNGDNAYVHIRYSSKPNGNPMTTTPQSNTLYIGVVSNSSASAPGSYSSYTWSRMAYTQPADGPAGTSMATYIRYSDDINGSNVVAVADSSHPFIGVISQDSELPAPANSAYTWVKYQGRGIESIQISIPNLVINYSDNTQEELDLSLFTMTTLEYIVDGIVANTSGLPLEGKTVRAYHKENDSFTQLGTEASTSKSGEYEIKFTQDDIDALNVERPDLVVKAFTGDVEEVASPLILNAGRAQTVNLAIGSGEFKGLVEYKFIEGRLIDTVSTDNVEDFLTADKVADLANKTNSDTAEVNKFVQVKKAAKDASLDEGMLFGLAKTGNFNSVSEMMLADNTTLETTLAKAVEDGQLDDTVNADTISEFITGIKDAAVVRVLDQEEGDNADMNAFFTAVEATSEEKTAFTTHLLNSNGSMDNLWNAAEADSRLSGKLDNLKRATDMMGVAGDATLGAHLYGRDQSLDSLIAVDHDGMSTYITDSGMELDERIAGETSEEKTANLATILLNKIEDENPSPVFKARIQANSDADNVKTFLSNETNFEFDNTTVGAYVSSNEGVLGFAGSDTNQKQLQFDLESMQRLFRIAPQNSKYETIAPLWDGNLRSATDILRMGEASFLRSYADTLGKEEAKATYQRAAHLSATASHVLANFGKGFNSVTPQVIANKSLADGDAVDGLPNLEDLFGAQDLCSCKHCRSVYSPAAYMVDLLHWLQEVSVSGVSGITNLKLAIDARRPELEEILLTCENTNTPLPYVDLVNEVLENAISSAPFYERQTTQKASYLKAHPEYLKPDVYNSLRTEVYPWTAPFDLFEAEAQVYLEHLGINFGELLEVFDTASSLTTSDIAAKELGMNRLEKAIIIADSATVNSITGSTITFDDYFGNNIVDTDDLGTAANGNDLRANVKQLMKLSGLSFNEIKDYLESDFINNQTPEAILGFSGADCNPDNATTNLTDANMLRMMRFHKLRMKLDWSIEVLDRAIALLPGSADISNEKLTHIAHLKSLVDEFGADIEDALIWWGDFNKAEYFDEPSFYMQQFANPAVSKSDEDYELLDPTLEAVTVSPASVITNRSNLFDPTTAPSPAYKILNPTILPLVMAGTRVSEEEAALLLPTGAELNVANLAYLFRVSSFCKTVGISAAEYLDYVRLFGIEPIKPLTSGTPTPASTATFMELVIATQRLGLDTATIDYLITDANNDSGLDTTTWEALLTELQEKLTTAKDELVIPADNPREAVIQYLNLFVDFQFQSSLTWSRSDLDELVSIMDGTSTLDEMVATSPSTTTAKQETIVSTQFADLLSTAEVTALTQKMVDSTHGNYVANDELEKRYEDVFVSSSTNILVAKIDSLLWPVVREQVISETLAEYFNLDADLCLDLMTNRLSYYDGTTLTTDSFISQFSADSFLSATVSSSVFQANGRVLHKAATVFNALVATTTDDLDYFYAPTNTTGLPSFTLLHTDQITSVAAFNALWLIGAEHSRSASNGSLYSILNTANDSGSTNIVTALQDLKGWQYVSETLAELGLTATSNFASTAWYFQTKTVSNAVSMSMAKPETLHSWAQNEVTTSISQSLLNACKAKYGNEQWLEIAPEFRDVIRRQQRDALADYLIFNEPSYGFVDRYSLYEHFLIDTEMDPCRLTSRIKQANSTIQLFVQRIIMNLERSEYNLDKDHVKEWEWRKNYRVWEANRKVFLYPENWIEPELRDDKSNFFNDLEDTLLGQDVTMESATEAYLDYLEKLDEVSDLQVMQVYQDDETKDFYVFARTKSSPNVYYFRKWEDDAWWTHWEKVDMDIEGDHLVPAVYNGRLVIFWPTLREEAYEKSMADIKASGSEYLPKAIEKKWVINLNWSEFKNGKWSKRKRSKKHIESYKGTSKWYGPEDMYFKTAMKNGSLYVIMERLTGSVDNGYKIHRQGEFLFEGISREPLAYDKRSTWWVDQLEKEYYEFSWPVQYTHTYQYEWPFRIKAYKGSNVEVAIMDDHNPYTGPSKSLTVSYELLRKSFNNSSFLIVPHQIPIKSRLVHGNLPFFFFDRKRTLFVRPIEGKEQIYSMAYSDMNTWTSKTVDWVGFGSFDTKTLTQNDYGSRTQTEFWTSDSSSKFVDGNTVSKVEAYPTSPAYDMISTTTKKFTYSFHAFDHKYVDVMIKQVNKYGVEGLLRPEYGRSTEDNLLDRQLATGANTDYFDATYDPNTYNVDPRYPKDDFDFSFGGGYSLYNWELFFHAPLMVACELTKNQRFAEAQQWFHFIFDPTQVETGLSTETGVKRFWRTKPFHTFNGESSINALMALLNAQDQEMEKQVEVWRRNPFMPHAIARLRWVAYMKNVVMKYLDMLIAWGDQLFGRFSIESVNEATQIYLMAAQILGRKPELIDRDDATAQSYKQLAPSLDSFSNAMVSVENMLPTGFVTAQSLTGSINTTSSQSEENLVNYVDMLYFCIPKNEKLFSYWNIVADRLFKIRHCMNIEGVVKQMPLFEPPIDPGMLVKAAANGVSIAGALNDMSAPMPYFKFSYLHQKAVELTNDVKTLGGALLAALEKEDAEAIAILRQSHEMTALENMVVMKEKAIEEAEQNLVALDASAVITTERKKYYASQPYQTAREVKHTSLLKTTNALNTTNSVLHGIRAVMALFPELDLGASGFGGTPTVKAKFGGKQLDSALSAATSSIGSISSVLSTKANLNSIMAGADRRMMDWKFQVKQADLELKQLEQQKIASEIRKAMAEVELENHSVQIESAEEIADFLQEKFTNKELYSWMVKEISKIYFQAYQMAYDMAKKAEKAYHYEIGMEDTTSYISTGLWDSLKKGLLTGEKLHQDLKRLDIAFTDKNKRFNEMTKQVSLSMIDPEALETLRQTGKCDFEISEMVYDLDHPGHYMRRIKAVTVSIPCVTGPYTGVTGKLSLLSNRIRTNTEMNGSGTYEYKGIEDPRFVHNITGIQSISTSKGQNDSGMFELNFNDPRYLPFEGAGAASSWRFELPFTKKSVATTKLRQFDYNTISDLIVTVHYTAKDGGSVLKKEAEDALVARVNYWMDETASSATGLNRVISLKHEFPTELHQFMHPTGAHHETTLTLSDRHFPHIFKGLIKNSASATLIIKPKDSSVTVTNLAVGDFTLTVGSTAWSTDAVVQKANPYDLPPFATFSATAQNVADDWTIKIDGTTIDNVTGIIGSNDMLDPDKVDDIILMVNYTKA